MLQDTYQEIACCPHFTDNWQDNEGVKWNYIYLDEKVVASNNSAIIDVLLYCGGYMQQTLEGVCGAGKGHCI